MRLDLGLGKHIVKRLFLHLGNIGGDGDHDIRALQLRLGLVFKDLQQHGLHIVEIGDNAVYDREGNVDGFRRFFKHRIGLIPIRVHLILTDNGDRILFVCDLSRRLIENFEVPGPHIYTVTVTH